MPVLRAAALLALAAPAAALLAGAPALTAPKPIVASRAGLAVATVSDFEEETPAFIQTVSDLGITAMRLGTCALMVHHGFDKIQNVDAFSANVVAKFFGFLPGPRSSGRCRLLPPRSRVRACWASAFSRARLRLPCRPR